MRLRSQRIVTPGRVIAGELIVEDGRISELRRGGARSRSSALELGDRWLVPGYIDMHVHGGGGAQCNTSDPDEIAAVARFHARHGTTAMLATTVAAPPAELERALGAVDRCAEPASRGAPTGGAAILGAHLEGPFLSPARPGAMDPSMFLSPRAGAAERLLASGGTSMRMMTLAPELPGALELIGALADAGAIASIGHSDATYAQARAAVDAGARAATHLFNAMRPFHHREPGVVGAALDLPEVSCEVICDGVHVDPAAFRVVARAKGAAGIRLVTDAIEAAGMPDGSYRLGAARVEVSRGVATLPEADSIAGSTLTMDAAVRNAARFLRIEVPEAVALASANPARLLGVQQRKGSLSPGMDADLVVLDEELLACATMVAGRWVDGAPELREARRR
jgi:N-acetylglucosamine-6-phosphate deacetylase